MFWKTGSKLDAAKYIKSTDSLNILKVLKEDLEMYAEQTDVTEIITCGIVSSTFMLAIFPDLEGTTAYMWHNLKIGNKEVKYYGGGNPRGSDWGTTARFFD